jgi:hypothetical protein
MSNCNAPLELAQGLCGRPDADHLQLPGTPSSGRCGRLVGDSVELAPWSARGRRDAARVSFASARIAADPVKGLRNVEVVYLEVRSSGGPGDCALQREVASPCLNGPERHHHAPRRRIGGGLISVCDLPGFLREGPDPHTDFAIVADPHRKVGVRGRVYAVLLQSCVVLGRDSRYDLGNERTEVFGNGIFAHVSTVRVGGTRTVIGGCALRWRGEPAPDPDALIVVIARDCDARTDELAVASRAARAGAGEG